jgi:hypothetical protein
VANYWERKEWNIQRSLYIESFDDGNKDFIDLYEFSTIDPDEPYGVIITFDSVE